MNRKILNCVLGVIMLIILPECDKIEDIYNDLTGKNDDEVLTKKALAQINADYL
jgi:type III secretory pathway lipoprotein EscJ